MGGLRRAALFVLFATALLVVILASVLADRVTLSGVGAMPATVVVDGRRGACFEDQKASGPTAWFWNIRAHQACHSEIIAFAEGRAMNVAVNVSGFTNGWGDDVPMSMSPHVAIPVNVFVMAGDAVNHDVELRLENVKDDLKRANEIFGGGQCGLTFTTGLMLDESAGNFTPDLLSAGCEASGNVARFNAVDPAQTAKPGVKVFYVEGPSGLQGAMCPDGVTAVIIITLSSSVETLAHELGHAFSLLHPAAAAGMPIDNLMFSPSPNPGALTLGQCYRSSINTNSVVNLSGFRTGLQRTCADNATGSECLKLNLGK